MATSWEVEDEADLVHAATNHCHNSKLFELECLYIFHKPQILKYFEPFSQSDSTSKLLRAML